MRKLNYFALSASAALLALALLASPTLFAAQAAAPAAATTTLQPITLPAPLITGGAPLMQALSNRKTTRAFADKPLPLQTLSNLLWAGFGINRKGLGKGPNGKPQPDRTAPSARNDQEINLYVVLVQGVYVYDAENNQLKPAVAGDQRGKIGSGAAAHAAVTIVFVGPRERNEYSQVDTGFIAQNIYLYAASEGLNAWFYAFHNQDIAGALGLGPDKAPLYGQSVGYPEK